MDYAMPRAYDLPPNLFERFSVPILPNPLSVKGAGTARQTARIDRFEGACRPDRRRSR